MLYTVIKFALSAALIVGISEISKRSTLAGSILASLPLVSVMGMIWLYIDTKDTHKVSELSSGIFWLVVPSLLLFLALPHLLKRGLAFPLALVISIAIMLVGYGITVFALSRAT
jgi:hypothetical protein